MKHKNPRCLGIFCRILKKPQFRNYLDFFFHYREVFYLMSLQSFRNTKGVQATVTVAVPLGLSVWMITKRQITPQKPCYFPKIHIRMMNWQNIKETNPVTSTAIGEFQAIPGRRKSVVSVLHSEFIFATSVFHITERLKLCLVPL